MRHTLHSIQTTKTSQITRGRHGGLSFYQKKKTISNERLASAASWVFVIALAIVLSYVAVYAWGVRTSVIGNSMEPELYNGQEVLIDRIVYNVFQPSAGDVIVFKPNGNANAHTYVKRVIAVPGDTVRITGGVLYLNGEPQNDLFDDSIADAGVAGEEITVGEDEFFVMGDNCNSSEDSRSANIGNVKKDTIIGRAWLHMAGGSEGIGRIK